MQKIFYLRSMLKQQQQLQQQLQQRLSPQQIVMIRMLELNAIELEERIKQELVENPALDEGNEEDPNQTEYNETGDQEEEDSQYLTLDDYRSEDDIPDYAVQSNNSSAESKMLDIPFTGGSSFHDFLLRQVAERNWEDTQQRIAEYIVGNIDDDGYLRRPLESISDDLIFQAGIDATVSQLEEILDYIQDFEPAGVGATNLRESLLLQIERLSASPTTMTAYRIIEHYFEEFSKHHYDKIARALNLDNDQLRDALHCITSLNPKPGNAWSNNIGDQSQHIIPDFVVETQGDDIAFSLSQGNIPELRISRTYIDMARDYAGNKKNQTRESRDALSFLKQKMDSAQWFIDAVKQRQHTLMSTMQVIIALQRDFFFTGDESTIHPMILKDIAERTKLDISTISRATNGKYVETDFGIFPLKFFFSESMQNDQGEEVSTREIKALLRKLIEQEEKQSPLPDDQLCAILNKKGYPLARRTVAKYREQLGIPVARLRKTM